MTAPSTKRIKIQTPPLSVIGRTWKQHRNTAINVVKLRMCPTFAMICGVTMAPEIKPAKYADPENPITVCDRPISLAMSGKKVMCMP